MDASKLEKGKKGIIVTTWERCKSIGRGRNMKYGRMTTKSKSWPRMAEGRVPAEEEEGGEKNSTKRRVAPEGCFSVYVGPERQRFVIKAEYANHPLFKMLLEEAESEYGYSSKGPLWLPCNVDVFYKVLSEMDGGFDDTLGSGFCSYNKPTACCSYQLLSPSRMVALNKL